MILVVDDSLAMRMTTRTALEALGADPKEIAEAADGAEALEFLESHAGDVKLVLADWIMPNVDGLELLRRMKQTPGLRDIPVIMITSQSQTDCVVQAMKEGASDYLVKPFEPEVLGRKLTELAEISLTPSRTRRELSVLVVDDSETMRKFAAAALANLKDASVEIIEAADGVEAMKLLDDPGTRPDLVLADWEMPNMDGLELLRQMKCSELLEEIPFIMLTNVTRRERVVEAIREGARGFMIKPFKPEALREKVAEILDEQQVGGPKRTDTMIMRRALAHVTRPVDANVPFLMQLPQDLRAAIRGRAVRKTVAPGQILVRFNDVVAWLHIIEEGEVEIMTGMGDQVAEVRKAGDCFGEGSFLTGDSAALVARAKTEVIALSLDKRGFERVLEDHPYLGVYLSRLLSRQTDKDTAGLWSKLGSGLSGELGQIALVEVVQSLNGSQKTGVLHLSRPDAHGEIYFDGGEIRHARAGNLSGEEAFFELLRWSSGSFSFKAGPREFKSEKMQSTMYLLMEGMRRKDENSS